MSSLHHGRFSLVVLTGEWKTNKQEFGSMLILVDHAFLLFLLNWDTFFWWLHHCLTLSCFWWWYFSIMSCLPALLLLLVLIVLFFFLLLILPVAADWWGGGWCCCWLVPLLAAAGWRESPHPILRAWYWGEERHGPSKKLSHILHLSMFLIVDATLHQPTGMPCSTKVGERQSYCIHRRRWTKPSARCPVHGL